MEVNENSKEMAIFAQRFKGSGHVGAAEDAHDLLVIIDNVVGSGGDAELGQTLMVPGKGLFVAAGEERRQPMGVSDFPPDTGARPERHVESAMPEFCDHLARKGAQAVVPGEQGVIDIEEDAHWRFGH